jgi:CelD/BcsL family acetyltransferase involved in cellulose biosynthesis
MIPPAMPAAPPESPIPTRWLHGPDALDEAAALWQGIESATPLPAFQRLAWARAWLRHLGGSGTACLLLGEGPEPFLWPLVRRRHGAARVLTLLGDGVSDYLGPVGPVAPTHAIRALLGALDRLRPRVDLIDLRSLVLDEPALALARRPARGASFERVFERCPLIDTTGSWDDFLRSRKKKFRANLKRAARRAQSAGENRISLAEATPSLLAELDAVERESWKWANGTAYFRSPARKAFLEEVLLDPAIPSEIWVSRVEDELAGFAVVFRAGATRHYYLPSFRTRFSDVGTHLLGEIVRASFDDDVAEVDLLQGDEGYKMAWATGERAVHEWVASTTGLRGRMAAGAVRLRWRLARSERAMALRRRLAAWRGRQQAD